MTTRLENWGCRYSGDDYTAPELRALVLVGEVYNHPGRHHDGKKIQTSQVMCVKGREIETRSGTQYVLGEVSPEYLHYLEGLGFVFDPENPIKSLD